MEVSLLSWNMRGSGIVEKLLTVRTMVQKFRPSIVGLQETKGSKISVAVGRSL